MVLTNSGNLNIEYMKFSKCKYLKLIILLKINWKAKNKIN